MNEQELLAVLDMSEDEQFRWCWKNTTTENGLIKARWYFLADLAFTLRDEAVNMTNNFVPGRLEVYKHCCDTSMQDRTQIIDDMDIWFISCAKPICWIIAALIAKEKEDA